MIKQTINELIWLINVFIIQMNLKLTLSAICVNCRSDPIVTNILVWAQLVSNQVYKNITRKVSFFGFKNNRKIFKFASVWDSRGDWNRVDYF